MALYAYTGGSASTHSLPVGNVRNIMVSSTLGLGAINVNKGGSTLFTINLPITFASSWRLLNVDGLAQADELEMSLGAPAAVGAFLAWS